MVSRVCEFVCQSELSYFVPGVRVRQLSKLSFRVVVIPFSFFARAKVVKVINSFLKLFSGLKSFVYPPRCKYCNSVVFHPLLYAIDISFLQNLRYFSMFFRFVPKTVFASRCFVPHESCYKRFSSISVYNLGIVELFYDYFLAIFLSKS